MINNKIYYQSGKVYSTYPVTSNLTVRLDYVIAESGDHAESDLHISVGQTQSDDYLPLEADYSSPVITGLDPISDSEYNYVLSGGDEKVYYEVRFLAGPHGTISGTSYYKIESGQYIPTTPAILTNPDYTFRGWAIQGTVEIVEHPELIPVTASVIYVAQYAAIGTHTVNYKNYDPSKGTIIGATSEIVKTGESPVNVPTVTTNPGWDFAGWYLGDEKVTPSNIIIRADTDFWAYYKAHVDYVTVTFDSAEGSAIAPQVIEKGTKATEPAPPTLEDYAFIGWYLNGVLFNFNNTIAADITLTAKWQYSISPVPESHIVDWTAKIDYSKNIVQEEFGDDIGASLSLTYANGNAFTDLYNEKNKTKYGAYKYALENKTNKSGTEESTSFLTAAMESKDIGGYRLLKVSTSDQDSEQTAAEVEFEIAPTICQIASIGEKQIKYPIACFKSIDENINFGYDDETKGVIRLKGLHQYFDYNARMYNYGRRITAYIWLTPKDVESILFPNNSYKDFRGVFRLFIDGETVLCRLEKIADYNPASGDSTKCQFIKER